jgi:hypothetical protein
MTLTVRQTMRLISTTPLTTLRPRWWGLWPRGGEGRGCAPDEAGREGSGSRTILMCEP